MLKRYPPKTREKLMGITALGVLLALAVSWNNVVRPAMVDMSVSDTEKAAETRRQALIQELEATEKKVSQDEALLSAGQEVTWLIEALNQMAQETDVTLVSAQPVGKEPRADYEKTAVRLEVRATYHQLGEFASRIENSERFIKIMSARLERPLNPEEAKGGRLNCYLALSVFNAPQKEAL